MPRKKQSEQTYRKGKKDVWQIYSLQSLPSSRFAQVVSNIVKGRYSLVGRARPRAGETGAEK